MIIMVKGSLIPKVVESLVSLFNSASAPRFGSAERVEVYARNSNFRAAFSSAGFVLSKLNNDTYELRRFNGFMEDTFKFVELFDAFKDEGCIIC